MTRRAQTCVEMYRRGVIFLLQTRLKFYWSPHFWWRSIPLMIMIMMMLVMMMMMMMMMVLFLLPWPLYPLHLMSHATQSLQLAPEIFISRAAELNTFLTILRIQEACSLLVCVRLKNNEINFMNSYVCKTMNFMNSCDLVKFYYKPTSRRRGQFSSHFTFFAISQ